MDGKKNRFGKYGIILINISVFVLAAVILVILFPFHDSNRAGVNQLQFYGTYQTAANEAPRMIENNKLPNSFWHKEIVLKGHFGRQVLEGESILFFIKYLEVHIYVGQEEVYAFGSEEQKPDIMKSAGMTWSQYTAEQDIKTSQEVTILLKNRYHNNFYSAYSDFLEDLYVGDSGALARRQLLHGLPYIMFSALFISVSIVMMIFSLVLSVKKIRIHKSVYYFVLFSFSVNIWMMLEPRVSTLFISNAGLIMELETMCMFLTSIFIMHYIGSYMKTKIIMINKAIKWILSICFILFLLLQLMGVTDPYAIRTVLAVVFGLCAIASFAAVIYEIKHVKKHEFYFLLGPGLVFLFFAILEMINYGLELINEGKLLSIGLMILLLAQFVYAFSYIRASVLQSEEAAVLEKEIAQSRLRVMLSQIQPHFLLNSLTAIQQLCEENPQKAEEAIEDFADFLRGNISILSTDEEIPFTKELQQIRAYLSLEQIRYAEKLTVLYDLKAQDFLLPSLTVQPIVENAVRHGIAKKAGKGCVNIATREEKSEYRVIITDDGIGFDPELPLTKDREHIGIQNVVTRLHTQCGGKLMITSKPGEGTTAVITIPKGDRSQNEADHSG